LLQYYISQSQETLNIAITNKIKQLTHAPKLLTIKHNTLTYTKPKVFQYAQSTIHNFAQKHIP